MPVDKQVIRRRRLLDKCFGSSEGMTYNELRDFLEEQGIIVSKRTLQNDIDVFTGEYGACFKEDYFRKKEKLLRYEEAGFSVFSTKLMEEEKSVIRNIVTKLRYHDDIPHYQWMIFLLEGLVNPTADDDIGRHIEFGNNLDLVGSENFMGLLEACVYKYAISLKYKPYGSDERPLSLMPYMVKQSNNRWFLIAQDVTCCQIGIYPFDRIVEGSVRKDDDVKYVDPDWDEIDKGLSNTLGISGAFNPEDDDRYPVADIVLRVSKSLLHYIETKPIFRTQEILPDDDGSQDFAIVRMDGVRINYELTSFILSKGSDIIVLKPQLLRDSMKEKLQAMLDNYR